MDWDLGVGPPHSSISATSRRVHHLFTVLHGVLHGCAFHQFLELHGGGKLLEFRHFQDSLQFLESDHSITIPVNRIEEAARRPQAAGREPCWRGLVEACWKRLKDCQTGRTTVTQHVSSSSEVANLNLNFEPPSVRVKLQRGDILEILWSFLRSKVLETFASISQSLTHTTHHGLRHVLACATSQAYDTRDQSVACEVEACPKASDDVHHAVAHRLHNIIITQVA
mmetsp:Transcript_23465/g.61696  ORF Transcript_23465/g.61696 Transcript_23465/m.61696 type:complete len:225 (+) Transcript_23465:129-803(+)